MNRRKAREMALQALFQITLSHVDQETAISALKKDDQPADPYIYRLLTEVDSHKETIDQWIQSHLVNWSFERIGNIDKTILRLAVCELLYFDDIPAAASINEAIELCRKFGDEQSRKFVNGVLSGIVKELNNQ